MSKSLKIVSVCVLSLAVISLLVFAIFRHKTDTRSDETLQKTLQNVGQIKTYVQSVKTHVKDPDKDLEVDGIYFIDGPGRRYASISTTTMVIKRTPKSTQIFTLENIAIVDDVYTRIHAIRGTLRTDIAGDSSWHHFRRGSVPPPYANVSIIGPILDNLSLFKDEGKFLSATQRNKEGTLMHYTFKLSPMNHVAAGPLAALMQRIGESGTIEVWIDPMRNKVERLRFINGDYESDTTISKINENLQINAPL